jgi:hypothetical protein
VYRSRDLKYMFKKHILLFDGEKKIELRVDFDIIFPSMVRLHFFVQYIQKYIYVTAHMYIRTKR